MEEDESCASAGSAADSYAHSAEPAIPGQVVLLDQMAKLVSQMKITRPEVLRATKASRAFRHRFRALRFTSKELFPNSFQCERIGCFWSHSWHGPTWKKILTLLVFYNGPAAITVGWGVALAVAALYRFVPSFLPGLPHTWSDEWVPEGDKSTWSMGCGCAAAFLTLILWRPQQDIFLDRICISEADQQLKRGAILSLAGILRSSASMLVLWDSSWSERLWCLFELSAFLKSKADRTRSTLSIRPTFGGPCSIAAFVAIAIAVLPMTALPHSLPGMRLPFYVIPSASILAVGSCTATAAVLLLRGYFRSVADLKERLRSSSLAETRASCCDCGHSEDGSEIICDRKIVERCIGIWFGSVEAFEHCVRHEILETMSAELDRGFSMSWCLAVTSPVMWGFLDVVASDRNIDDSTRLILGAETLMRASAIWLFWVPPTGQYIFFLTRCFCKQASSFKGEVALNLLVMVLALPAVVAAVLPFFLNFWIEDLIQGEAAIARGAFHATCMLFYALLAKLLSICRPR